MKFPRFRSKPDRRFRHSSHYEGVLGTSLEIQIVARDEGIGVQVERAILEEIDRLGSIFNAYDPASELSRWQTTFESEVRVSAELAYVLENAEAWRRRTAGAFNPATEAFTRLWKSAERNGREPSRLELAEIESVSHLPLWELNRDHSTARRLTQLPITLNSIAKGYIVDQAAAVASQLEGVQETLINIGGDIRHIGTEKTVVAIADPFQDADNAEPVARIELTNRGIATSGNYRRGFAVGGRWFSHLIDPRSGRAVEDAVGVSVFAPNAETADVLATACSVLKPEEALAMADSWPATGLLLISQNGQRFSNETWRASVIRE